MVIALDTEGTPQRPYSLQFAIHPGHGFMIRATDTCGLGHFRRWLSQTRPTIVMHNSLYDLAMLRQMSIDLLHMGLPPFEDSMVAAYLLQVEPQGLKSLCLRHCGMQMQSYSEVLGGADMLLATDYLWSLFDIEELEYEQRQWREFEAKLAAGRRVKVLPKLPRNALHKAVERCLKSKKPRKLWLQQIEDGQHSDRVHLGRMPEPTLDHVDPETAIRYGCRDADGTLRLYHQLKPRMEAMGLI